VSAVLAGALVAACALFAAAIVAVHLSGRNLVPVRTGSMGASVPAGSLVVAERVPVRDVRVGTVMLFHAPTRPHPLVIHRVQGIAVNGRVRSFVTKGDANHGPDPWLVRVSGDDVWRVRHVVPVLGRVYLLLARRDVDAALLLVAVVPLVTALAGGAWRDAWNRERRTRPARRHARTRLVRRFAGATAASVALAVVVAAPSAFGMFTGTATVSNVSYATGVLLAPSPLTCKWVGANDVQLTWTNTSPTFALGYDVARSNTSGSGYAALTSTTPATATTTDDTNPSPPTVRYYVVTATHAPSTWTSPTSNEVATTDCSDVITTIAGSTSSGFSGDGGAATGAKLNNPTGIASDASGNVYVADTNNNRIRRIDAATGVITTVAGGGGSNSCSFTGPATSVALARPSGVAVDASGDVYIADTNNNCVRELSGGTITPVAGGGSTSTCNSSGPATSYSLNRPGALALDTAGTLYVADTNNNCVRKVTSSTISYVAGGGASSSCSFTGAATSVALKSPTGLAVDGAGNVYVADAGNNCVRMVSGTNVARVAGGGATTTCSFSGAATSVSLSNPSGVAVDASGRVLIADTNRNCIRVVSGGSISQIAGTGTNASSGDGGFDGAAAVSLPDDVAVLPSGDVVITTQNHVRNIVTPA
jgi:signal peptidase I